MDIKKMVITQARRAKDASYEMLKATTKSKNKALEYIALALDSQRTALKKENEKDITAGKKKGLTAAFLDRLTLNDEHIDSMIKSLKDVIKLTDPVGEITSEYKRPNGMKIKKIRMPLGVIVIIFESRPNVCIEAAALTIKSGNSVILRGGSDAINSNIYMGRIIKKALLKAVLPEAAVEVMENTDRKAVAEVLKLKDFVDVIIPRGGKGLVNFVADNSRIPVIYHDAGICHTFIDKTADLKMALKVSLNAKVQRPSTCNSMETLLVHEDIARKFLPVMAKKFQAKKVELRVDEKTLKIVPGLKKATEEDWGTEYNDLILSVKVVKDIGEAITHINHYSSHHSDAIITKDDKHAVKFTIEVDSAAVFVNASTRLNDGYEFGLGAEIGISNQKLHARGPVGLKELTSEKYIVFGTGQLRG
ncbi:MAG: glutamate-5-semialdehyde dehydrogenase [bacterium]